MAKIKSQDLALKDDDLAAEVEKLRRERAEIGDPRQPDWFPPNPAFHRIWVTDTKNQIGDHLKLGFSYVMQDEYDRELSRLDGPRDDSDPRERGTADRKVSRLVGRAHTKDNAVAYLLQMPVLKYRALRVLIDEERQEPLKKMIGDARDLQKTRGFFGEGLRAGFSSKG